MNAQKFENVLSELDALSKERKLDEAIKLCNTWLAVFKGNSELWLRKAIYSQLSDSKDIGLDEIKLCLKNALIFQQKRKYADVELANFLFIFDENGKAYDLFSAAAQNAEIHRTEAVLGMMKCLLENGKKEEARALAETLDQSYSSLEMNIVLADLEED